MMRELGAQRILKMARTAPKCIESLKTAYFYYKCSKAILQLGIESAPATWVAIDINTQWATVEPLKPSTA